MWSTRARLAAGYAGLLFATLLAFCIALYFARREWAMQQLGRRAVSAADNVVVLMRRVQESGVALTARDTTLVAPQGAVSPLPALRATLEPRPGFFLVLDDRNRLIYSSFAMRQLDVADQQEINQQAVISLRVNFILAIQSVDWANVEASDGRKELEDDDPEMAAFRTKLVESFEIVNTANVD